MYSRQPDRNFRVPHNYSGNIFSSQAQPPTPVEDHTRRPPRTEVRHNEQQAELYEAEATAEEALSDASYENSKPLAPAPEAKRLPAVSPLGELGTEEILLIALALIIFQSGKEPELALILLALLFIS